MTRERRFPIGLDVTPQDQASFWYNPELVDPRVALSEAERDRMILIRHEAGLPDWPPERLYPDFPVMFEPPDRGRQAR
jgi:hypothetical protein